MQTNNIDSWKISLGIAQIPKRLYAPRQPVAFDADMRVFLTPEKKQDVIAEIEKRLGDKTPCRLMLSDFVDLGIVPGHLSMGSFRVLYAQANKAYKDKHQLRYKNEIILELWDSGIRDIDTIVLASNAPKKQVFIELNKTGRREPEHKWKKGRKAA